MERRRLRRPPPPASRPPASWGTEQRLRELFGDAAAGLRTARREFTFRYASPAHWIEVFRRWYGPVQKAFAALPPDGQAALEREIAALIERFDRGGGRGVVVAAEYLEAVIETPALPA